MGGGTRDRGRAWGPRTSSPLPPAPPPSFSRTASVGNHRDGEGPTRRGLRAARNLRGRAVERRRCPGFGVRSARSFTHLNPLLVRSFKLGGPGQDVYTEQCKHGLGGALIKRNRRKLPLPLEMPFSASAAGPGMGTGFGPLSRSEVSLGLFRFLSFFLIYIYIFNFRGEVVYKSALHKRLNTESPVLGSLGCRTHIHRAGEGGGGTGREGEREGIVLTAPPLSSQPSRKKKK